MFYILHKRLQIYLLIQVYAPLNIKNSMYSDGLEPQQIGNYPQTSYINQYSVYQPATFVIRKEVFNYSF